MAASLFSLGRSAFSRYRAVPLISAMDSVMAEAIKDGELNVSRLNVSDLLSKVFNTLLTHRVKLDASFTSVMIAVTIIEGIGKALDPRMNLLAEAAPFLI